jgi:hypothetical protein
MDALAHRRRIREARELIEQAWRRVDHAMTVREEARRRLARHVRARRRPPYLTPLVLPQSEA